MTAANESFEKENVPVQNERPAGLDPAKLSKLGLLVAGIAHNLYGPLTGILGTMDLLRLKHPEFSRDFDRVTTLGRRMQNDIRVMLQKAEVELSGRHTEIHLDHLIRNELEFYKGDPRFKHMIETTFDAPDDLPVFHGVPGDFTQSFSNLLTNAIEAMENASVKKLNVTLSADNDTIVLSVADTGAGMDEETLAHAFDPFFTTKTPSEGNKFPATLALGLGLTHAKSLLEPLGVTFAVDSTPGEGTTVTLTIPYRDIEAQTPKA